MTIPPFPRSPLVDSQGNLTRDWFKYFQDLHAKTYLSLDIQGQVASTTKVSGRTEGLGSTLQNVDSAGVVLAAGADFSRAYVNKDTDHVTESASKKYRTSAHSASQVVGATITGVDDGGGQASITVTGASNRVPGQADYAIPDLLAVGLNNSTKYYIYYDDPDFDGSGGNMVVTTDPDALFSNAGRFYTGTNTTPAGGAGNTTGVEGGNGGGVNRNTVLA